MFCGQLGVGGGPSRGAERSRTASLTDGASALESFDTTDRRLDVRPTQVAKNGGKVEYIHADLGQQPRGAVGDVRLHGNAANVRLVDTSNLRAFKSGRRHTFYGGHYRRSPVRIPVPRTGHWHVVVDLGGYPGRVGSSVRILPGALSPGRSASPPSLDRIIENAATFEPEGAMPAAERQYDVFVSHATEDKDELVRPLAHGLQRRGLVVWYDEFELRLGDSLRRKIDLGLAASRFGVVVLSPAFFAKNWPAVRTRRARHTGDGWGAAADLAALARNLEG